MDLSTVAGIAGSLKAVADLAKTLADAKSQVDRQAAVSALQGAIIAAQGQTLGTQQTLLELQAENDNLRRQLAAHDDWSSKAAKFEQRQIALGVIAYKLVRPEAGELDYWACPGCFQNKKISILQTDGHPGQYGGTQTWYCNPCSLKLLQPHQGRDFPQAYLD